MGNNEKRASGHFPRVRKYTKFGVFYTKIVQMTPEVMEGVILTPEIFGSKQGATSTPEFMVTNTVLSLPFSQQIQFTLIVNIVNLN